VTFAESVTFHSGQCALCVSSDKINVCNALGSATLCYHCSSRIPFRTHSSLQNQKKKVSGEYRLCSYSRRMHRRHTTCGGPSFTSFILILTLTLCYSRLLHQLDPARLGFPSCNARILAKLEMQNPGGSVKVHRIVCKLTNIIKTNLLFNVDRTVWR